MRRLLYRNDIIGLVVLSVLFTTRGYAQPDIRLAESLIDSARIYLVAAAYQHCERTAITALEIFRKLPDTNDLRLADAYYYTGLGMYKSGKRTQSTPFLRNALRIRELLLGETGELTGDAYYCLASALVGFDNAEGRHFAYKTLQNATANHGTEPHSDAARANALLGQLYMQDGKYDSAHVYLQTSIDIHRRAREIDHEILGSTYNTMGWYYENHGDLQKAKEWFKLSDEIYRQGLADDHPIHGNTYVALANILLYEGKHAEARHLFDKALAVRIKKLSAQSPATIYCYVMLGITLEAMGKYEEAKRYNKLSIALDDELYGKDNRWSANIYNNLGMCYAKLGAIDSARYCYLKSLNDNKRILGEDNFNLVFPIGNLAELYETSGDLSTALYYHEQSLRLCKKNYGANYRSTIESLTGLAKFHHRQSSPDVALPFADEAILSAGYDGSTDPPFMRVQYPQLLLDALTQRSKVKQTLYNRRNEMKLLQESWEDMLKAEDLIEHTRNAFSEVSSKQLLADQSHPSIGHAITIALTLYKKSGDRKYLDAAFRLGDKSKALSVLESMHNLEAQAFAGVPAFYIDSLYIIQSAINDYEERLSPSSSSDVDQDIITLRNQVAELKLQYQSILAEVERDYPEYYALKYQLSYTSLEEIQQYLRERNKSLITYFLDTRTLTTFIVTKDSVHADQQIVPDLDSLVRQMCGRLREPHRSLDSLCMTGYALYLILIEPYASLLKEDVIIIPDGALGYLPFETLVTEVPQRSQKRAVPWLLYRHVFQYAHSAGLLIYHQPEPGKAKSSLVTFAPDFDNTHGFTSLGFNRGECRQINKLYGGTMISGSDCTPVRFQEMASTANILHIATHAKADDRSGENAFLAFGNEEDKFVYVRDLYNMRIPAQLAVLSACETGIGELRRGEGIISLARAFSYAGTKAIVTSLWSVNDQATSMLMTEFYRNLSDGLSKDVALRQSKITYLENCTDPLSMHPYYWASFIAIGDMSPLDPPRMHARVIIGGGVVLLVLGLFLTLRKRRQRK